MSKDIAVIGSGGWGTAAAVHLNKLGHKVSLWSWLKESMFCTRLQYKQWRTVPQAECTNKPGSQPKQNKAFFEHDIFVFHKLTQHFAEKSKRDC